MLIVLLGVFVATTSVVLGIYLFVNRRQLAAAAAARTRLASPLTLVQPSASILRDTSASELPFLDRLLAGRAVTTRLTAALERAGVATKPGTFVIGIGIASLCGAILGTAMGGGLLPLWMVAGAAAPLVWLRRRGTRRLAEFQAQLPDALDMLVGAMRAGYSLQTAMKFIGDEMPAPLGPEFNRFYDEQRLGMEVREALTGLQHRIPSSDLHMFVTAVLVQRETGGNLAEILGNIADVMRQRSDIHRQIETLTAESKLSGRVLALLPGVVFFALLVLDPSFMRPMLEQPLGQMMLISAGLSVTIGYIVLMQIAKVDL